MLVMPAVLYTRSLQDRAQCACIIQFVSNPCTNTQEVKVNISVVATNWHQIYVYRVSLRIHCNKKTHRQNCTSMVRMQKV